MFNNSIIISGLWPEDESGSTLDPEWKKIVRKEFREVRDEDGDMKLDDVEVKNWIVPDISEHVKMEAEHLIEEADSDQVNFIIFNGVK